MYKTPVDTDLFSPVDTNLLNGSYKKQGAWFMCFLYRIAYSWGDSG